MFGSRIVRDWNYMPHSTPSDLLTVARLARLFEVNSGDELSLAQYRTLGTLLDGGQRASRLAERLAVPKPTLTALVDSLVARGLLVREEISGDRRGVQLSITPEGRTAHENASRLLTATFDDVLDRAPDSRAVLDAIDQLRKALDARLADKIAFEQAGNTETAGGVGRSAK
jgi:DNA-binding MarR family transcriptional regulator